MILSFLFFNQIQDCQRNFIILVNKIINPPPNLPTLYLHFPLPLPFHPSSFICRLAIELLQRLDLIKILELIKPLRE